jgi:hypothetical protein
MAKTAVIALLVATAAAASPVYNVRVCWTGMRPIDMAYAQKAAKQMFQDIGVLLEWHDEKHCPAGSMQVNLVGHALDSEKPGIFAYSYPYEGAHIVVFLNRIARMPDTTLVRKVLAHVLVHEITHILQGISRHSETGVMKASWDGNDYLEMGWKSLPFAPIDVTLIHRALAARMSVQSSSSIPSEEDIE